MLIATYLGNSLAVSYDNICCIVRVKNDSVLLMHSFVSSKNESRCLLFWTIQLYRPYSRLRPTCICWCVL